MVPQAYLTKYLSVPSRGLDYSLAITTILIICENAAPEVHQDLEAFMLRLVPDGDPEFLHDDEGPAAICRHT